MQCPCGRIASCGHVGAGGQGICGGGTLGCRVCAPLRPEGGPNDVQSMHPMHMHALLSCRCSPPSPLPPPRTCTRTPTHHSSRGGPQPQPYANPVLNCIALCSWAVQAHRPRRVTAATATKCMQSHVMYTAMQRHASVYSACWYTHGANQKQQGAQQAPRRTRRRQHPPSVTPAC